MLTTNQILQQGRYRIVNQLGQNGIGVGYEAFDNTLGASVLLKEIRENSGKVATAAQIEAGKMNFAQKAKPLTELKHESLLLISDFFSEINHHYLVTELIDGSTLGELLEKKKSPFPMGDVANWAENLLEALNYLHTHNPQVIHGEVKPQNIRLAPNGKVKLHVFNLVGMVDEKSNASLGNPAFDAAALPYLPLEKIWNGLDTASRKVILTNYDEKSEKILEQPADPRSDVYSLAATLYHLLTARPPADALTRSIDILEGKEDPLQSPSLVNPSVPPEVSEVLLKGLEIKRENRFSSAVIMRQVLRTAFVRLKERETSAARAPRMDDDAVLEIPVAAPKPVEPKPAPVAKSPEIESEQARQLELIKQQLREAEERRLEAERRAAEAEKQLLEAKKQVSVEPSAKDPDARASSTTQTLEASAPETEKPPVAVNEAADKNYSNDEFSSLFAEPEKESGVFKKVAAAGVALLVLGGAGFGIWTFVQPKSAGSVQTMTSGNSTAPQPTVEATPAVNAEKSPEPTLETASENTAQPTEASPTEPSTATTTNPAVKPKTIAATPTPQTAQVKKPTATPAKQAEKKVTLDDLLKDN